MTGERSWTVGETEARVGRYAQHVGAVVSPIGDDRDACERGDPREGARPRQVGMSDEDPLEPCGCKLFYA